MTGKETKLLTLVPKEGTGDPDLDRRVLEAQKGSTKEEVSAIEALNRYYNTEIQKRDKKIEELEKQVVGYIAKNKELEAQIGIDDLTGAFGQKKFNEALDREYELAKRSLEKGTIGFALIIFDLNDFKGYNDKYGYLQGNEALKAYVDVIKKNSRKTDIVGKWGGDEAAVILPHTNLEEAMEYTEKVLNAMKEHVVKAYDPNKHSELIQKGTYIRIRNGGGDTGRNYQQIRGSAGIFVLDRNSNTESYLDAFELAELAQRHAKKENDGGFTVYSPLTVNSLSKSDKK